VFPRFEELLAHIDDADFGHGTAGDSIRQFEQRVFAGLFIEGRRVEAAFEAGSGGAENDAGMGGLGAYDGDIAAVIARVFFLFIARVVLFIDHDEAEVAYGREDAGAGADDDAGSSRPDAAPLAIAFAVAEGAVEDGDAIAEAGVKLAGDGGREGDFRNEKQCAASGGEGGIDGVEVDLGFAGAGNALQEEGTEFARFDAGADQIEGGALGGVEVVGGTRRGALDEEGFGRERDELFAREGPGGGAGVLNNRLEFAEIVGAGMKREIGEEFALGFGKFCRRVCSDE